MKTAYSDATPRAKRRLPDSAKYNGLFVGKN